MHWFRIDKKRTVCLETGLELTLNKDNKNEWGIHLSIFGGLIILFGEITEEDAYKKYEEFLSKELNLISTI